MSSASLLRTEIEARLQSRIPAALSPQTSAQEVAIQSGVKGIEIPLHRLTEICAPAAVSSGRTALLNSLMAKVTSEQRCCALVDASDSFDPTSSAAAGVDLERVLWVRCAPVRSAKKGSAMRVELQPLEQAFRAADMILQAGGFTLMAVDLAGIEEKLLQKIPLTTWFRFSRAMERMAAALLFLTPSPLARSCAALTLRMRMRRPEWKKTSAVPLPHATLLAGLEIEAEIVRARKAVQSSASLFSAHAFRSA